MEEFFTGPWIHAITFILVLLLCLGYGFRWRA